MFGTGKIAPEDVIRSFNIPKRKNRFLDTLEHFTLPLFTDSIAEEIAGCLALRFLYLGIGWFYF